jgi:hypothetical protein
MPPGFGDLRPTDKCWLSHAWRRDNMPGRSRHWFDRIILDQPEVGLDRAVHILQKKLIE